MRQASDARPDGECVIDYISCLCVHVCCVNVDPIFTIAHHFVLDGIYIDPSSTLILEYRQLQIVFDETTFPVLKSSRYIP